MCRFIDVLYEYQPAYFLMV